MRVRIGRRAGRIGAADSPRQRAVEPCRDTAQSEPTTQKIPRHSCKGELWCEGTSKGEPLERMEVCHGRTILSDWNSDF